VRLGYGCKQRARNIDLKNDIKAAKKIRLPGWLILCMIIGTAFSAEFFDHFGRVDLVLPIVNSIGVLGLLVALKWKLRRHAWFWITMSIIAALHVPLILFVPWTTKWVPALAIAAIDSVDFYVILAILSVLGNIMEGPKVRGPSVPDEVWSQGRPFRGALLRLWLPWY
jgi:hypothetical protein